VSLDPRELDNEDLKRELDDALGHLSQEELEQMSQAQPAEPHPDEKGRISGRIIDIRGADVFVDVGGKSEAYLPLDEFEPDQPPVAGQMRTFVVQGLDTESGLMRLSLREALIEADLEALRVGDVVEGRVTGVNLGGLELLVSGIRAFMPKSHVDLNRVEDFAPFINRRLECQVTEIDRRARNLVVSRRRVMERQREQARQELRYALEEGQVRQGVVRRIADFGVFVDLGGVDGLLHISDMSYGRTQHPSALVKVGDEVEVQVLKIDLVKDRISLGMKQLAPDPWELVSANYHVSDTVEGRVVKLMDFGAFVELEPGVEGLVPVSEMSWSQRVRHPRDLLNEGDSVRASVLAVDPEQRRISLSLKALVGDPWKGAGERYAPEAVVSGRVTRVVKFGAFVQLEEGIEGLLHISELSDQRVRRVSDVVETGQVIKVRIKSVDFEQRRIALTLRGLSEDQTDASKAAHAAEQTREGQRAEHPPQPPPERKRKRPLRGGLTF
jgi:small subunit ribosomal protein S1